MGALEREHHVLLQTLLALTRVNSGMQAPAPAPASLTLRRLTCHIPWAAVAQSLGTGVTQTSCIIGWDDVAEKFRNIIQTHYRVSNSAKSDDSVTTVRTEGMCRLMLVCHAGREYQLRGQMDAARGQCARY